jgi:FO synthase
MHAIARLALHPLIQNIQASWVKMGPQGAALCLNAGVNDLGGTLMNESITRAAGGVNGQLLDAAELEALARHLGRPAVQRTTLYGRPQLATDRGARSLVTAPHPSTILNNTLSSGVLPC